MLGRKVDGRQKAAYRMCSRDKQSINPQVCAMYVMCYYFYYIGTWQWTHILCIKVYVM